ncbi:hypothetical protein BH24CHL8_BH24CHL8_03630 [soil metagenome]
MSEPPSWNTRGPLGPPPEDKARRLSPVSFGDLLEITARLARRHAGRLLVLATLFLLPAWLLNAAAGLQLVTAVLDALPLPAGVEALRPPVAFTPEQTRRIAEAALLVLGTSALAGSAAALAGAAFSDAVERDYHGLEPSVRHAGARALRRSPAILGTLLLSTLALVGVVLGGLVIAILLTFVGGVDPAGGGVGVFLALVAMVAFVAAAIVMSIRWSLSNVVVALEEAGPLHALVRSWRLTAGAAWRTLGTTLVVTLVAAVIGGLISELLGLALADLILGETSQGALIVRTVIGALLSVAFAPLLPLALTVLYFDQRVRREALDVKVEPLQP